MPWSVRGDPAKRGIEPRTDWRYNRLGDEVAEKFPFTNQGSNDEKII